MHVCMYACMYVCMLARMHVYNAYPVSCLLLPQALQLLLRLFASIFLLVCFSPHRLLRLRLVLAMICVCARVCVHAFLYVFVRFVLYVCLYGRLSAITYMHLHVSLWIHVMYVCNVRMCASEYESTNECRYVCLHACMHVRAHTRSSSSARLQAAPASSAFLIASSAAIYW